MYILCMDFDCDASKRPSSSKTSVWSGTVLVVVVRSFRLFLCVGLRLTFGLYKGSLFSFGSSSGSASGSVSLVSSEVQMSSSSDL